MNIDRRNSVYSRLSLNTTNVTSPIAESTHLNGSSINSKFPWGGKLFSPPKSLVPSSTSVLSKTTMSPINKIDQRVYIDVQSRGLASRIVRYHENGFKLNRSLSIGNTYNKPGQFPIVHLKKKEIVYKPSRNQNISMVKIAPPDKSVFQANTRSSILRTGSIVPTVGLPRSDDEVSRENRPILHPVGSELAPTKSVLDALREISRKRINSDELDTNDSVKKYCKDSDDTDRGVHLLPTYNAPISKRQREGPSCSTSNASVSPEQMSKKRMFSKNNDVLSSLSSSLRMSTPKRKFDDIRTPKSSEKVTPPDASTSPQLKQQCNETNFVSFQNIDSILACQITPLPPTPAVEPANLKNIPQLCPEAVKEKSKPKLTLFNKNYDEAPTKIRTTFESNLDDFASGGVITFVKPRNNTQISDSNLIIEKTKKSKLALMLSGLVGETNEDVVSGSRFEVQIEESSVSSSSLPVVTTISSASISFETKTTTATIPTVSSAKIGPNDNISTGTSMPPVTVGKQDFSRGSEPSAQSSIPLSLPNSIKTTTNGLSFLSQVSNPLTTATSSTLKPVSSSAVVDSLTFSAPAAKPTSEASDSSLNLKSVTTPALMQPQFSFDTKPLVSVAGSLPAFSMASPQNATKISFGVPNSIAPAVSSPLKISTSSTLAPKSTGNEMEQVFGVSPNNQSVFSAVAGTEGPKTSQPLTFSATQSAAATTNITSSLFSAPSTSLPSNAKTIFGVSNPGTVKTDSQNIENNLSRGFSFVPLNPGGDPKANTTPFAFSSNPNQKPAGAGSGVFSFTSNTSTPVFGIPSTSTQITTAPAFGVPSTSNSSSNSGAADIQFSFSGNNGKPSTGFTLAGAAGENKQQTAVTSAPFSFGTPKPQPAPTSNALLTNHIGQEQSNLFTFGAPNPQQKPVAASSIFGGTPSDGKIFNFSGGEQKAPAPTNRNIFETASNSFATPAPTTALNFSFTPQTTANSIFGAPTTTTSNSFRMPQTTASSVFGAQPTSTAPAFGVTTAPAPSSIFGQASISSSAFGAPKTIANSVFAPSMSESKPAAPLAFGVPASSNIKKSNKKTFSFGANNPTPTGGFSFNAAAANTPSKGGVSAAPTAAPLNSFNFRQGQSINNNAVFGSPVTTSTNASSVFGSPTVSQTKTFNFSAGSNAAAPSNPFGSVPAENKTDNNFNFGANPQQPANTGSNNKPFAFGGIGASSAFTFNTTPSSAAPASIANKAFNFGGSPAQSANQPNNSSPVPFAFTSGTNGPAAAATTQANIFSPGQASQPSTTTNTTRDRVIRIATRRLNK